MKALKIAVVTVLFALAAIKVYQEIQFRKPLTATEVDQLAAITAADCSWRYDSTRKGDWLRRRSVAERKVDATFQTRFETAMGRYRQLDPDSQCALLDQFPDLVQRWQD